ncbi:MAG TPA: hypothetical protein VG248_01215 [Caulobacteraceae bacterium]|nr:hypothetical protein [Caulobacteraceae bacterium]
MHDIIADAAVYLLVRQVVRSADLRRPLAQVFGEDDLSVIDRHSEAVSANDLGAVNVFNNSRVESDEAAAMSSSLWTFASSYDCRILLDSGASAFLTSLQCQVKLSSLAAALVSVGNAHPDQGVGARTLTKPPAQVMSVE